MAFEPFIHFMKGIQGRSKNGSMYSGQNPQEMAYVRNLQKEMKQGEALHIPLSQLDVVVIDIETTGFYPDQGDEIISIGAVKVCGEEIKENQTFYSLIQYNKELPFVIEELTGIRSIDLKEAPSLSEVLIQFFDFVQNSTLVAHHSRHEKNFLQNASWKLFRAPFKNRLVDTSFLYRIAEPELKITRLEDFCEYNEIQIKGRHHALGDAKLTAKLWSLYIQKVQRLGCKTLSDVYERIARM